MLAFEGKVFNEKALYNKEDPNWQSYQKWQGWMRAKSRNAGRKFNNRETKMTIHIVDTQAVDTRYTKQWKEHPCQLQAPATNNEVVVISGGDTSRV